MFWHYPQVKPGHWKRRTNTQLHLPRSNLWDAVKSALGKTIKRNEDMKTESILGKILKYKSNWLQHVKVMQGDRLPKLLKNLHTFWTKTPWKTAEVTFRLRVRNESLWPNSLTVWWRWFDSGLSTAWFILHWTVLWMCERRRLWCTRKCLSGISLNGLMKFPSAATEYLVSGSKF